MKIFISFIAMLAVLSAQATPYTDATGDLDGPPGDDFSGFAHLDISGAEISNDATTIFFSLTVNTANINSPDWGKYMFGIDSVAGGDTSPNGNGWARPISMSAGMDYWIGSWIDGGSPSNQNYSFSGSWSQVGGAAPIISGPTIQFVVPLAQLGLNVGDSFTFDAYTSGGGGGDSAVDALGQATPSITGWGGPYDSGANVNSYTVVPEPSTLALLGLAGCLAAARRMRRK